MFEKVQELIRQQPFKPCQVRLTNGKSISIRDPKNVIMLKSRVVVCFPKADRFDFFDAPEVATIDYLRRRQRNK